MDAIITFLDVSSRMLSKGNPMTKVRIITALIGYGGGCVADGIGHDWKSGRHGQGCNQGK